eukprot:2648914-Rhodomonas_salina.3
MRRSSRSRCSRTDLRAGVLHDGRRAGGGSRDARASVLASELARGAPPPEAAPCSRESSFLRPARATHCIQSLTLLTLLHSRF